MAVVVAHPDDPKLFLPKLVSFYCNFGVFRLRKFQVTSYEMSGASDIDTCNSLYAGTRVYATGRLITSKYLQRQSTSTCLGDVSSPVLQ